VGFFTEMKEKNVIVNDVESDWSNIRKQVLKRDNYTCQRRGKLEAKCDRSLDVHHIIPYNKGGLDTLDNLSTLCPRCHPAEESKSRVLYDGTTAVVKRKDRIRDGFVAHTFHLPKELDDKLRMEAVKNRVRYSDIAITAFERFLGGNKK
jgi:hypothetical protein